MTIAEGGGKRALTQKFRDVYLPTLKANFVLWPAVQILNFRVIPIQFQIVSLTAPPLRCFPVLTVQSSLLFHRLVSHGPHTSRSLTPPRRLEYARHSEYHVNDLPSHHFGLCFQSIFRGVSVSVGPYFLAFVYKGYRIALGDMIAVQGDLGFIHCIRGCSFEVPISVSSTAVCIWMVPPRLSSGYLVCLQSSIFNSAMKLLSSQVKRVLPKYPRPSP